jgi:hypothetical protein
MEEIGLALPANSFFEKPMLLSVVEIQLYFNSDFESIRTQCNHRNNSRCRPLASCRKSGIVS